VHMTMQEPEECPLEGLGLPGFKFIMLVDDPEETLGEYVAETVQLVREGCLEGAAISLIKRSLDLNSAPSTMLESNVKNKWLSPVVAVVIFANALCAGVSEDFYKGHIFWNVMEVSFTFFFVLELIIDLKAEGVSEHFFGIDYAWSWFDFIIVLMALTDTVQIFLDVFTDLSDGLDLNKFTIMRLARVVRVARLMKILRLKMFEELTLMISGVVGGMRTLFWAFVLLLLLIYTLGILMRQVTRDVSECGPSGQGCSLSELQLHKDHKELFGTVFRSMFTVFRCFTEGCTTRDGTQLPVVLWDTHGWVFVCGYILSLIFVIFGVFNVITAVFVENVLAGAKHDEQKRRMARHGASLLLADDLRNLVHKILNGAKSLDPTKSQASFTNRMTKHVSSSTTITKHIFERLVLQPDVQQALENLEVSVYERGKLFDFLDADGDGELGVDEMVEGILRLRGPLEKGDVVSSSLILRYVQRDISLVDAKITEHQQLMERMRTELAYAVRELKGQVPQRHPSSPPLPPTHGLIQL